MTGTPKLLDLFCGQGGATRGYQLAGFRVTGVDLSAQPRYCGDEFVQADAIEYVKAHGHEFDAIHASPPCQINLKGLAAVNRSLGRTYDHPDLIQPTRAGLEPIGRPWVMENVEGSPLRPDAKVCGTGLGMPLRRHRLFEVSAGVALLSVPCAHDQYREPKYWTSWRPNGDKRLATTVQVYGNAGSANEWGPAMGIDWMDRRGLAEAIPPAYTEFIGSQLLASLEVAA